MFCKINKVLLVGLLSLIVFTMVKSEETKMYTAAPVISDIIPEEVTELRLQIVWYNLESLKNTILTHVYVGPKMGMSDFKHYQKIGDVSQRSPNYELYKTKYIGEFNGFYLFEVTGGGQ